MLLLIIVYCLQTYHKTTLSVVSDYYLDFGDGGLWKTWRDKQKHRCVFLKVCQIIDHL